MLSAKFGASGVRSVGGRQGRSWARQQTRGRAGGCSGYTEEYRGWRWGSRFNVRPQRGDGASSRRASEAGRAGASRESDDGESLGALASKTKVRGGEKERAKLVGWRRPTSVSRG